MVKRIAVLVGITLFGMLFYSQLAREDDRNTPPQEPLPAIQNQLGNAGESLPQDPGSTEAQQTGDHLSDISNTDLAIAYEESQDLAQFTEGLWQLADQGHPDSNYFIVKAHQECHQFLHSEEPQKLIANLSAPLETLQASDPSASIGLRHWEQLQQRCSGFITSDQISQEQLNSMLVTAAEGGHRAARLEVIIDALIQQKELVNPAGLQSLITEIISTQDQSALLHLPDLMGLDAVAFLSPYSGTDLDQAAWTLVSCDLGLDCSSNHPVLKTGCMLAGTWCRYPSIEALYAAEGFPPNIFERMKQRHREILSLIHQGDYQALFLEGFNQ